jgi:hypothetical protein
VEYGYDRLIADIYNEWVQKMRGDGVWANEMVVIAASYTFDCRIRCLHNFIVPDNQIPDGYWSPIYNEQNNKSPVLNFGNESNRHFIAISPIIPTNLEIEVGKSISLYFPSWEEDETGTHGHQIGELIEQMEDGYWRIGFDELGEWNLKLTGVLKEFWYYFD